mmetsp:Transcript_7419/g.6654  ORF Transcript_7419/g.6654 Transcript_7419/m.6654 type:complete len:308 (+) Transcript_7419:3-926(+)
MFYLLSYYIIILLNILKSINCNNIDDTTHVFIDEVENLKAILWNKPVPKLPTTFSNDYKPIIPLHLHHIWTGSSLMPIMNQTVTQLLKENPEFTYHLYNDNGCYTLIKNHFDDRTLLSYQTIVPGAFKADLCRYCALYHYGGIYIDIKYRSVDGFKLLSLTDKEHYALDRYMHPKEDYTVNLYNAIIIVKEKSDVLKRAIDIINTNVETRYYGKNYLYITGPKVLGEAYIGSINDVKNDMKTAINKLKLVDLIFRCCHPTITVRYYNQKILEPYPEYRQEQAKFYNNTHAKHYTEAWYFKEVYGEKK